MILSPKKNLKRVAEAYDVLSNKEKRQNYDMYGSATGGGNPFRWRRQLQYG